MKKVIIGFILGAVTVAFVGWNMMPNTMLKEAKSPYSIEETVAKIKANAEAKGWVIPSVQPLHKSIKKHSGGKHIIPPVMLVNLCNAEHAYNTLVKDQNKKVSVFMPCTISVFEKNDSTVWVAYMNAKLLGDMFGGDVAKAMVEVDADQRDFIKFVK
ncbi:hypothetical protein BHECKSOX_2335 [Bathymodiolus heckerae thiotrophic gill symbiont]|uniref:DUF302 domain-containing protein n=1 Tax=Bathymodiolus heckerae thiotrophic gill symbiont TaxID=1052212 RepID=UPI0010B1EC00|nr:DUF302 domain-containing protein [Bathymodiolus heckerae thiotrophic gill symbiont]SHN91883.1 hypothetical protein BHECKSOX_2335 [Bathymodiolus heckerae thiotrophic gill symbiont]